MQREVLAEAAETLWAPNWLQREAEAEAGLEAADAGSDEEARRVAGWHAALLRGCGRRRLGFDEDREDDSYWGDPIKVLHHVRGSGEELAKQGGCEQVQELGLRCSGVKAQQLTEVLPGFTRLKTLDLSHNQLGAADASAIASVLKTMQISSLECVAQP